MSTPFLGEIDIFPFSYAPKNWAQCNGQTLPIAQNQALFSLLGTVYGGDGRTTFALPNLQGVVPIGYDGAYPIGANGGEAAHMLIVNEMPQHTHALVTNGSTAATTQTPSSNVVLGQTTGEPGKTLSLYGAGGVQGVLDVQTVGETGQNQAHPNMAPFLTLNFCIALSGIFPSRN